MRAPLRTGARSRTKDVMLHSVPAASAGPYRPPACAARVRSRCAPRLDDLPSAERVLLAKGWVRPGDDIAVTFGLQDMHGPGCTDVLKLWRVRG